MKRIVFLAMLFLILALALSIVQAQAPAEWTFMVYMAADNDLESFAINDLMEMQAVGSTDDVNIIVQIDRAEGYEEFVGGWTDTRRFRIEAAQGTLGSGDFELQRETYIEMFSGTDADALGMSADEQSQMVSSLEGASAEELEQFVLPQLVAPIGGGAQMVGLQQTALEAIGESNTGDPQTLVDFVTWTVENFPAEHYALQIWNHGGGWIMVASDESTESHDALTLTEFEGALADIREQTGIEKFDLLSYDACLMSQLEVFQTIAPYADYSIASEELIPGAGWEYVSPLSALTADPSMDAPTFGQIVVDSYINFYSTVITDYDVFDLGLIDLSQVDAFNSALADFSAAVAANPEAVIPAIADARNNAQYFAAGAPDEEAYFSSVDILDFMTLLAQHSPDAAVTDAANNVIAAGQNLVLYHQASEALANSQGISVFFPQNAEAYAVGNNNLSYPEQSINDDWESFLATYNGTAQSIATDLSVAITSLYADDGISSIYSPPVIVYDTDGSNIMDVRFAVALQVEGGNQIILDIDSLVSAEVDENGDFYADYEDGLTSNEFYWNVEMPVITDGETTVPTVLLSNTDNPDEVIVSGDYYMAGDTAPMRAYLSFDLATAQVSSVWGVSEGGSGSAPHVIWPEPGDVFIPSWRFIDAEGNLQFVSSDSPLYFSNEPFTFDIVAAPSGNYTFTIIATDAAGNEAFDVVDLAIDNEGLDSSYRGFKDLSFGINFLYPWDWADPILQDFGDDGVQLFVSDPNEEIFIYVEAFDAASLDETLAFAEESFAFMEGINFEEPIEEQIGDYEAIVVPYDYVDEYGVEHFGAATVIYVEENGLGYLLNLDAPSDLEEEANAVFNAMVDSLNFFAPVVDEE
jgi:hypothetical protein